jgi:hypothetical protein
MMKRTIAAASLICLVALVAYAAEKPTGNSEAFEEASARFEQNATDGDVEAVFDAIAGDDGLASLTVTAPDGRKIVDFTSPGHGMGMRQFRFESPEPTDVAALKKAFPDGVYMFTGSTASGMKLESQATLSHKLPPTTSFVSPVANAGNVASKGLKISWAPVKGVSGYTIELDPSKTGAHLEMKLPASATSFVVPDGILAPNAKCQLGIGTVSRDGNVSVIETTFTTAAK